jgi:hypothetical protein
MSFRVAVALLAFAGAGLVEGADLYRWTDGTGRVHYGETVPNAYRVRAKRVDATDLGGSPHQLQEAQARLAREKGRLNRTVPESTAFAPSQTAAPEQEPSCEAQWDKFDESWACFNPFRTVYGAVKPEAYEHCSQIPAPSCTRASKY